MGSVCGKEQALLSCSCWCLSFFSGSPLENDGASIMNLKLISVLSVDKKMPVDVKITGATTIFEDDELN